MKASARLARPLLALIMLFASALVWSACTKVIDTGISDPSREDPGLAGLPTENPTATRTYLATLRFTPDARLSTITCDSGATPVTLRIYPEVRSHQLDTTHAKLRGRIVARVVNAGSARCAVLRLSPNDTAYWWMGPNRGYPLTTDFWRIPLEGVIRHLAQTGPTIANPESVLRRNPDAIISDVLRHPAPVRYPEDNGDGGSLLRFAHNSTWIACLGACCESTGLEAAP